MVDVSEQGHVTSRVATADKPHQRMQGAKTFDIITERSRKEGDRHGRRRWLASWRKAYRLT